MSGEKETEEVLFDKTFEKCDPPDDCDQLRCLVKVMRSQEGLPKKLVVLVNDIVAFSVESRKVRSEGRYNVYELKFNFDEKTVTVRYKAHRLLPAMDTIWLTRFELEDMLKNAETLDGFAKFLEELKKHYANFVFNIS